MAKVQGGTYIALLNIIVLSFITHLRVKLPYATEMVTRNGVPKFSKQ